jgi:glycosyltransferase involved in cell wall biosynthesis
VPLPLFVEPASGGPTAYADRRGAAFAGRLDVEKGVRDVIRLAELVPSNEVTVAGHGPLEGEVSEAAARLPNLTFAGSLERAEVLELLGEARACLMPSRWQEPAGLAALEAMSVGTPVIAYASGGLADYVGDAGGGRVIEPDTTALARELEELERDRETWEELSAAGVAGVAAGNSPEAYAVAIERVYEGVIG